MPTEVKTPAVHKPPGDLPDSHPDATLDDLRQILFRRQIEKIEDLEDGLAHLEHRLSDEGFLVKMIAPVLGEAIRLRIKEARDEVIEALYPVIGKVVQRAVTEAVADLARSLDAQAKRSFDFRVVWWRMKARFGGASEAHIRLRQMLPFEVTDVLLIHRETGLLLHHIHNESGLTSDTDLFSGMLTAIRDFSHATLGGEEGAGLGEITYGDHRILIETARYAYLAVIVDGVAPPGFLADMRDCIAMIENTHAEELRDYQGDAQAAPAAAAALGSLMEAAPARKLSANQKRFLAGALGMVLLFLGMCGLYTYWVWRLANRTPPVVFIFPPTATFTLTPTSTATFTPTATHSPTPAPTFTPTYTPLPSATWTAAPAPILGVILGNVWMHSGPSADAPRLGVILTLGERVELLAVSGNWVWVRRAAADQNVVDGWIPTRWFGNTSAIPFQLITPSATP